MGHDRTTRRADVAGKSELMRAIGRAMVPARAKRDITDPGLRGRSHARLVTPLAEPEPGERRARTPAGKSRPERRAKALGPTGRARQRVDAIPHGKVGTKAKRNLGRTKVGQKAKAVKGSPSAKRRVQNRVRSYKARGRG